MLKPWSLALLALLSACGYKWSPTDADGDGFTPEDGDCWDAVQGPDDAVGGAMIYPGAPETWYNGIDEDCAGDNDYDQDGDGVDYATADHEGADCDDQDASVYPGAEDVWYDGIDSDCAGDSDFDQDGDGCDAVSYATDADCANDCDDADADVNPGAEEIWYDGVDQNCDGRNDYDQDGDGYIKSAECDDEDATRYPDDTIEEIWYNGVDENCDGNDGDQDGDGFVPDDYADAIDWTQFSAHLDRGDCWDDPADLEGHVPVDGSSLSADEVNPEAVETWYDGVDQDCTGDLDFDQDGDGHDSAFHENADGEFGDDCIDGADEDDPNPAGLDPADVNPSATDSWYDGTDQDCAGDNDYDQDADGYEAAGFGEGSDDDCDDTLDAVNPGARETCATTYDDDCDGDDNDPSATGCDAWYVDSDGDGQGSSTTLCLCEPEAPYLEETTGDCDDSDGAINSAATEIVGDEVDQNCDGVETCYADLDNDDYRTDSTRTSTDTDCRDTKEARAVDADGDCDDTDEDINPGATEITGDGVDQNCDGKETCYADADNDDYRTSTTVSSSDADCSDSGEALSGMTSGDCDDTDEDINPGATEITGDNVDQNCDGTEVCYVDADDDGYRKSTGTVTSTDTDCTDSGEATSTDTSGDCKDTDATINPGATEITGDGVDQNCDNKETCYANADGDSYRTSTTVTSADSDCSDSGEALSSVTSGDCDDADATTYPGASEVCEDDTVNDCSATEAEALAECGWDGDISAGDAYARRYGEKTTDLASITLSFLSDMDGDGDDEVVIGATGTDAGKGSVYVLTGSIAASNAKLSSRKAKIKGESPGDEIGFSIGDGQDVNGDGYGDLLMGAPYNNGDGGDSGSAYLFVGPLNGDYTAPTGGVEWIGAAADNGGASVAGVGDLDGDGYDDILVGSTRADFSTGGGSSTNRGAIYFIEGPATSGGVLSTSASAVIEGKNGSDLLGNAASAGGDVNGDGDLDLLFGGSSSRTPTAISDDNVGLVFLYLGPTITSGVATDVCDAVMIGATNSDAAGTSLDGAADVDGDGYDDILIGAPGVDTAASGAGAAYLIYGEATPTSSLTLSSADAIFTGVAASDAAGTSVSMADLTGDGLAELVVGAPAGDPDGGADRGAAYLFFGDALSGSVSLSTADVIYAGQADGDALGTSVAAGGDPNKDGYGDLLLGAPYRDQAATDDGITYYFQGTGY